MSWVRKHIELVSSVLGILVILFSASSWIFANSSKIKSNEKDIQRNEIKIDKLESIQVEKMIKASANEAYRIEQDKRMGRIEGQMDRIESKIDKLLKE